MGSLNSNSRFKTPKNVILLRYKTIPTFSPPSYMDATNPRNFWIHQNL